MKTIVKLFHQIKYLIFIFKKSDLPRIKWKLFLFLFNLTPSLYCLKYIRNLFLKCSGVHFDIKHNFFKGKLYLDSPKTLFLEQGYINFNVAFEGSGIISIGKNHKISPNVTFVTSNHTKEKTNTRDIHIGSDVWIGAGSIIVGGVKIGDRIIIGAGSIVIKGEYLGNGKDFFLYAGNPAKLIKTIPFEEFTNNKVAF